MSAAARVTPEHLLAMKRRRLPIVMVTAYDVVSGEASRVAGIDVVLVGDSAANVVLGYETTRQIGLDELLSLASATRRGMERAEAEAFMPLLVGDLPFGTYEMFDEQAVATALRFVREAKCDAVKLEGGGAIASRVRAIVAAGIPVMGHVGLLPQSAETSEELRVQGRSADAAARIAEEAIELEHAGCFSIVFEAIPSEVAAMIAARLSIPVIGIGAGAAVDGQVLVLHDLLGLHRGHRARFVKEYASPFSVMTNALRAYARDVRARSFPEPMHGYGVDEDELERARKVIEARD
jgi:3-methyl-2-oxobutanoate hydroxymethyltransferase